MDRHAGNDTWAKQMSADPCWRALSHSHLLWQSLWAFNASRWPSGLWGDCIGSHYPLYVVSIYAAECRSKEAGCSNSAFMFAANVHLAIASSVFNESSKIESGFAEFPRQNVPLVYCDNEKENVYCCCDFFLLKRSDRSWTHGVYVLSVQSRLNIIFFYGARVLLETQPSLNVHRVVVTIYSNIFLPLLITALSINRVMFFTLSCVTVLPVTKRQSYLPHAYSFVCFQRAVFLVTICVSGRLVCQVSHACAYYTSRAYFS